MSLKENRKEMKKSKQKYKNISATLRTRINFKISRTN